MSKSPAFQWYPKDFLTDLNVIVMTLEQRGAYITLLSQCWLEGSLPMEPAKLQAICNHPSNWNEIWDGVKNSFIEKNGQYINPRLEKERIKQKGWLEKSSKGGRRSAELRRESKGGSNMVATNRQPSGNSSSSSSSPSSSSLVSPKEENKKRVRREYPAVFERLWDTHPKGGKLEACKAMEKLNPDDDEILQWIEKLITYKKSQKWREGISPNMSTWINQGYFDGEVPDEKKDPWDQAIENVQSRHD